MVLARGSHPGSATGAINAAVEPRPQHRNLLQVGAIVAQILLVFAIWQALRNAAELGVAFLYAFPVGFAAWWYAEAAGVVTAIACLLLFLVSAAAQGFHNLTVLTLTRALTFAATVLVVGHLRRLTRRSFAVTSELQAMRAALTPPQLPEIPGLDAAATLLPAEHDVAGDFYVLTNGAAGWCIAIIGDVVGHGLQAAQLATFARVSLVSIAAGSEDPAEILRLANQTIHARTAASGEFVTVACVAYHREEPLLRWACAGHPPPIALPAAVELDPGRFAQPLGLGAELEISSHQLPFTPTDALLLYTDGLYEARDDTGERFGLDRVRDAVSRAASLRSADVVAALRAAVLDFTGRALRDDVCILALRPSRPPAAG